MKKVLPILGLLFVGVFVCTMPVHAEEPWLLTVSSPDGGVFSGFVGAGRRVVIQCNEAVKGTWTTSTGSASLTTDLKLAADEKWETTSGKGSAAHFYWSFQPVVVSATAKCYIYEVL